jgi:hypothetical protein
MTRFPTLYTRDSERISDFLSHSFGWQIPQPKYHFGHGFTS